MIIDNMDFYNVRFAKYDQEKERYQLSRVTEETISQLNNKAQLTAFNTCGVEIRFFLNSDNVRLYFSRDSSNESISSTGVCTIFQGNFQASYQLNPQIISKDAVVEISKKYLFKTELTDRKQNYNSNLVRVILPYDWQHMYLRVEGDVSAPNPEKDYPKKRFLAYGSSITHGGSASTSTNSYIFQLAQNLSYDYINWGFAGSCYLDTIIAEKILKENWNFLLLELGVNVLDWTVEEFEKKSWEFVKIIAEKKRRNQYS